MHDAGSPPQFPENPALCPRPPADPETVQEFTYSSLHGRYRKKDKRRLRRLKTLATARNFCRGLEGARLLRPDSPPDYDWMMFVYRRESEEGLGLESRTCLPPWHFRFASLVMHVHSGPRVSRV